MTTEQFNISLLQQHDFPLLVTPKADNDIWRVSAQLKLLIERQLEKTGAILLRGFNLDGAEQFGRLVNSIGGELLQYVNGSTPRSQVHGNVYTSTEYPPERTIVQHNEMAYSRQWPTSLWFYCHQTADSGGATPLSDSHKIYNDMPLSIREKAERYGIKYVRNYRPYVDLSWQKTFNTDSRDQVEKMCRDMAMQYCWNKDELKTWQICQGVSTHPRTGQKVWFNQAHLFHAANMDPSLRKALLHLYGEEGLPRHAFYGNGEAINDAEIAQIMTVIKRHTIRFDWQKGDVMVLDNMLRTHGREPYVGERKVLVAMNGQYSDDVIAQGAQNEEQEELLL
jgi:alpha-ketoglutarate-dependent taurine dioxygenase